MKPNSSYQHFHLEKDAEGILWIGMDRKDSGVNSLNREVFTELSSIIEKIPEQNPIGVVIFSAKAKGFIAGADITQFTQLKTTQEAFDLIRQAQLVLNKLEALKIPTVAMIKGFCMGGGLELALACRYRIACDDSSTLIGLPEVKLGIQPGWGGTVRLPRLIGAIEAMKMILPGEVYPAKKAYKVGIVDEALPLRELKRAARYYILKQPPTHTPNFLGRLSNAELVRGLVGRIFYHNLKAKHVQEAHYPAPYAIIRNWIRYGVGDEAMLQEAKSIADLMLTPTAHNLVRLFFLQERLKGLGKKSGVKIERVHVIGAGTMGGDIAAWCAYKGLYVTLQDQTIDKIAPAIKRAYQLFEKKFREPRLIQAAMDRLQPDPDGAGVSKADIVIEAIFENLQVKQQLFQSIEAQLKPNAILATNTSSIPLEKIGEILKDVTRLIGIHFFNPVAKMQLVEVVHGQSTASEIQNAAAGFITQISRLPLPVKSSPGFLVNRILMPYLLEAMQLIEEGIPAQNIDKAAVDFGMPMGPVALADTVGLDICLSVAENLLPYYGGVIPSKLKEMVAEGHLGVKSGQGFYTYNHGKKVSLRTTSSSLDQNTITERLILRMLNESVACLAEKVVADADLLDAGMVFGTGFAPFRGGPMQYIKTCGKDVIVKRLESLASRFGERFKPVAGWEEL